MTMRWIRRKGEDGSRWLLWPIRLGWGDKLSSCWFQVHGWEVGSEIVPDELTSRGKVPGLRALVGQTFHLGRFKVYFGRRQTETERDLIDTWARYRYVVALVLKSSDRPADYDGLMREHWALMAELGRLINRTQSEPLAFIWGSKVN